MRISVVLAVLVAACAGDAACAAQLRTTGTPPNESPPLAIGHPAPALPALQWLRGEPLTRFEPGQLYVVEFGATWCPPCRKAIPHLSDLSRRYAGQVRIVSIFASELTNARDAEDPDHAGKVRYLMDSLGDRMQIDVAVAVDAPQRATATAWNVRGIPVAYLVDRAGCIAWIGKPAELDEVLRESTAGTFDPARTAREQRALERSFAEVQRLKDSGEQAAALTLLDSLIQAHPQQRAWLNFTRYLLLVAMEDAAAANAFGWRLVEADLEGFDWDHMLHFVYKANRDPDYDLALAVADRASARAETPRVAARMLEAKADIYLSRSRSGADSAADDIRKAAKAMELATRMKEQ